MLILFVDDNDLVRRSLSRVMTRGGHEVVACGSAEEALYEIERGGPYDLVLSDFDLGNGTSQPLLTEVRDRMPATRIMLLTATANRELPAGIRCITKPIAAADLLLAIQPEAA